MRSSGQLAGAGHDQRGVAAGGIPISRLPANAFEKRLGIRRITLKRACDFGGSLLLIVILAPLLLAIGALIRITSPGPAIFTQQRYGRNGDLFSMYKFRTMYTHLSDASGCAQTAKNDPRVTPIGRILRRSNLDELPQLLNVLLGHMSLVGPRPHPPGMRGGGMPYEALVPDYFDRVRMRPGITGLAQVEGLRGPTVDAQVARRRIELDNRYIQEFSLRLDLKIMARTISREIFGGTGF